MRLLGFELKRIEKDLSSVPWHPGLWRTIHEPYAGAWQLNVEERVSDLLCYPTLFACISRITQDIGKLPYTLVEERAGIWVRVENPAYSPVLRKPNYYQTAQQFRESWVLSRLRYGNTYVLKERDERGVVVKLYVLDPCRVKPLVSDSARSFTIGPIRFTIP